MLIAILAACAMGQRPIKVASFADWDGQTWSGIKIGTSESELGKQVIKFKTVGPDPASVRIGVSQKGDVLTAILSDTNNKGSVSGFTLDLEKDQPIESLEALQAELGPPDFEAFPPLRFSDWSLAVWQTRGVAAAVQNSSRPLVYKVLLAPPNVLKQNLDLWARQAGNISIPPKIDVSGFEVTVNSEPRRRDLVDDLLYDLRAHTRDLMGGPGGRGWQASSSGGSAIRANFNLKRDKQLNLSGTLSISAQSPSGTIGFTESANDSLDHDDDLRGHVVSMFDNLLAKLDRDLDIKGQRLAWQSEWRQFTSLARPKG